MHSIFSQYNVRNAVTGTQLVFTCSKATIEATEQSVKSVQT